MNEKPSIGRIVGYVLPAGHARAGEVVPAVITRVWSEIAGSVQLTPFVDIASDAYPLVSELSAVLFDPFSDHLKPQTWHWLPRS